MKYTKVTYQKAFVIGPYLQEKVGIEIDISDSQYTPEEALSQARNVVETWHIANNPQVHSDNGQYNPLNPDSHLPIITSTIEEHQIGLTTESLTSCNDLTTLDSYRLLIKGKPDLEEAYAKRRRQIMEFNPL